MKIINKLFGFKTKNLYLAEVKKKIHYYDDFGARWYGVRPFDPRKYVLVRKKSEYNFEHEYNDIFTNTCYSTYYDDYTPMDNESVLSILSPAISSKPRITYKDAEKILLEKNGVYFKK